MEKKKRLAEYNYSYQKENIIRRVVKFNRKSPEDLQLLTWAEQQGAFSSYCRRLIRDDMDKQNTK